MRILYSKYIFLIVLTLLIILFCGCDKSTKNTKVDIYESEMDKKILSMINNEVNADDVIWTIYSPDDLMNMPYYVNEVLEKMPPECVRLSEDGKYAYFVYKSDDGQYAFCFYSFENNEIDPFSLFYLGQRVALSDFDSLNIGKNTFDDVKSIDPYGEYGMFELGMVNIEKYTTHYTSDGYKVKVHCNKNGVISKIEKKKIDEMTYEQDGFLALLLEKDKKLLMP